jgi:precorrin-4/cobalt-precorrin-4 C11-methyltransferase
MPERETLHNFGATGATLAIHLAIHEIEKIVEELLPLYGADCPVAIVFRATWPDERVLRGTLSSIAGRTGQNPIERTAIIFVGRSLAAEEFRESSLYDASYQRRYRGAANERLCIVSVRTKSGGSFLPDQGGGVGGYGKETSLSFFHQLSVPIEHQHFQRHPGPRNHVRGRLVGRRGDRVADRHPFAQGQLKSLKDSVRLAIAVANGSAAPALTATAARVSRSAAPRPECRSSILAASLAHLTPPAIVTRGTG